MSGHILLFFEVDQTQWVLIVIGIATESVAAISEITTKRHGVESAVIYVRRCRE